MKRLAKAEYAGMFLEGELVGESVEPVYDADGKAHLYDLYTLIIKVPATPEDPKPDRKDD